MPRRILRPHAPQAREIAAGRAVRELFERYGRMVHAVCRLRLRDRLDAEDATQQTFLAAYRSLLRGCEPANPPAWLAAIARNECSRVGRHGIATVAIDDSERAPGDDVGTVVERREEIEALAAALTELPPSQREAVVLREFYGLSYAEVAAALGVSGPAVESLLFKGRRRLQEKLVSVRVAGVAVLPDTVRDALVQLLPGFGGGAAVAGSKAVAVPAAAKVAVLAVVATGGGVTVAETVGPGSSRPSPTVVDGRASTARAHEPSGAASRAQTRSTGPTALPAERPRSGGTAPGAGDVGREDELEIALRVGGDEIETRGGDEADPHGRSEDADELAEAPDEDGAEDGARTATLDLRVQAGAPMLATADEDDGGNDDESEDGDRDAETGDSSEHGDSDD